MERREEKQIAEMKERGRHRYHDADAEKELEFLQLQQKLIFNFDEEIYDKILKGKDKLCILDVGCNAGVQIMSHFGEDKRVNRIVGIERDQGAVDLAKEKYPQAIFCCFDIETSSFGAKFKKFLDDNSIEKFDMINISMVLLHLENPTKLLKTLKSHLKPDGVMFIRDIDDGMNLAYPDKDGMFERLTEICTYCDMLGFRKSGRQIYYNLKKAGFENVHLEKIGLSTTSMTQKEKTAFFDVYFGYVPTALEQTIERHPDLTQANSDYEWAKSIINKAKKEFLKDEFMFTLGYMIYSAH